MESVAETYALNEYYDKAYDLILSQRARNAFDLAQEPDEMRDRYGQHTFGQSVLLARRLIEAGTRFVQVNWPSVANGDPLTTAWDTHAANFGPLKDLHCPKLGSDTLRPVGRSPSTWIVRRNPRAHYRRVRQIAKTGCQHLWK